MDESNGLVVPEESLAGSSGHQNAGANFEIQPAQLDGDILPSATGDQIAKLVKSNMKTRSRFFRRIARNAMGMFKSKLKNLFISKKVGDNKYVVEDGESIMDGRENELLHGADEDDADAEDGGDANLGAGNKPGTLVRHERFYLFIPVSDNNYAIALFTVMVALFIASTVLFIVAIANFLCIKSSKL